MQFRTKKQKREFVTYLFLNKLQILFSLKSGVGGTTFLNVICFGFTFVFFVKSL
jgi:hypothetical protein